MKMACFLVAFLTISSGVFAERKPNVLLIISDDQGYGDFGFSGNKVVDTPVLDQFSKARDSTSVRHLTRWWMATLLSASVALTIELSLATPSYRRGRCRSRWLCPTMPRRKRLAKNWHG